METFTQITINIIKNIPKGKVATYGQIALLAGNPHNARQVARILHSMSKNHNLPWHRVINAQGKISLPKNSGYDEQKSLLENEGVSFDLHDRVDFECFGWED